MFCPECGKKLEPGDRFCVECGAPVEVEPEEAQVTEPDVVTEDASSVPPVPSNYVYCTPDDNYMDRVATGTDIPDNPGVAYNNQNPEKKSKKPLIIGLAVAGIVAVVAAVVLFLVFGSTPSREINLNDYIVIEYDGYDGYGSLLCYFDYEAFENENSEYISFVSRDVAEEFMVEPEYAASCFAEGFFRYELLKTDSLSNGEVLSLEWYIDESYSEYFKIKGQLKYDIGEFTVSGLSTVDSFDAFADVSVSLDGIAPYGYVTYSVNSSEEYVRYLSYSIENYECLSNGDVVTIRVEPSIGISEYIDRFGKLPASAEKTFEVANLPEYVSSISQISASSMNEIKTAAENAVYKHLNRNNSSKESVQSVEYAGNYLQIAKAEDTIYAPNVLTMVYKVNLRVNSDSGTVYVTYYHVIRYNSLSVSSDGTCSVNLSSYEETTDRYYPTELNGNYYYYGYSSLQNLYDGLIVAEQSGYNFENNIL